MRQKKDESVASLMRSLGLGIDPEQEEPSSETDPALARAGTKLKAFRESSGWTALEISERTGVSVEILEAFEAGQPVAEDELLPALERVASACCCTIEELGLDRLDLQRSIRRPKWTRPAPLW